MVTSPGSMVRMTSQKGWSKNRPRRCLVRAVLNGQRNPAAVNGGHRPGRRRLATQLAIDLDAHKLASNEDEPKLQAVGVPAELVAFNHTVSPRLSTAWTAGASNWELPVGKTTVVVFLARTVVCVNTQNTRPNSSAGRRSTNFRSPRTVSRTDTQCPSLNCNGEVIGPSR